MDFVTVVPAKCILACEHVIINQGFAIVAPFKHFSLSLSYTENKVKTIKTISGEVSSLPIYLWMVIRNALELVNQNPQELTGFFDLKNNILVGAGLGFSAALCVAVAKWAVYYGLIKQTELFEFAVQLEDIFHVKSSGVDIAGVLAEDITKYYSTHETSLIAAKWKPLLYISSSGEKSITRRCVDQVIKLRQTDPAKGNAIDTKMMGAATQILNALESTSNEGFPLMVSGLNQGNECFYEWKLVSEKLNDHIKEIKKYAAACKIIGAGYGGHVVSLWQEEPPEKLPFKLIRLL